MATPRQIVYDLATGKVLMWGYCNFGIDPDTQGKVENETFKFKEFADGVDPGHPDSEKLVWYWDGETFTETPPEVEGGTFLSYLTGIFTS